MSTKKKYLIELYLKYSKYLFTAKENLKDNENFLKAAFQYIREDEFNKVISENGVSKFTEEMTSVIDARFTEEEIQALIDFFGSPLGRKLVDKSHLLKISEIMNDITRERQRLLSMMERVKKK